MTDLSGLTPAEQWRILGQDEPRQLGDRLYMAQWSRDVWTPWSPDLNKPIDHLLAIRRIDDPAEPLRRELRALEDLLHEASELLEDYMNYSNVDDIPAHTDRQARAWLKRNREIARNAAFGGKEGGE